MCLNTETAGRHIHTTTTARQEGGGGRTVGFPSFMVCTVISVMLPSAFFSLKRGGKGTSAYYYGGESGLAGYQLSRRKRRSGMGGRATTQHSTPKHNSNNTHGACLVVWVSISSPCLSSASTSDTGTPSCLVLVVVSTLPTGEGGVSDRKNHSWDI